MMVQNVFHEYRRGIQIIGRDVEEPLDLPGVEIKSEDAIGAGGGNHVGDELGRDRRARTRFTVLPGVAVIGDDSGRAPRRGAFQRVERDQQFHQIVVRRVRSRLDHEDVLATHVLVNLDKHLHVGEAAYAGFGQRQVETAGNRFGEGPIAVAGEDLHIRITTAVPTGSARGFIHGFVTGWQR